MTVILGSLTLPLWTHIKLVNRSSTSNDETILCSRSALSSVTNCFTSGTELVRSSTCRSNRYNCGNTKTKYVCTIYMCPVLTFLSASMFTLFSMVPAFWKENNPLKCLPVCIRLYDVTFHKTETVTPGGSTINIKFQPHVVVHFLISSEYAHNKNGCKSRKHVWYTVLSELHRFSLLEAKTSASITYCVCILK